MKDYQSHTIELDAPQAEFLRQMAQAYGLPDVGKAIRCLVNYAREHEAKRAEIFDEIRCTGC